MFLRTTLLLLLSVLHLGQSLHKSILDAQWEQWKIKHKKKYNGEEDYRRTIWEQNLLTIETHNLEAAQGKYSYRLKKTNLADMTSEEVAEKLMNHHRGNFSYFQAQTDERYYQRPPRDVHDSLRLTSRKRTYKMTLLANSWLPKSIDYRQKGLVTPVKDQGSCGSCWAFSAAGALEGQLAKKTGRLLDLSVQNLLDCVTNNGCNGGHMIDAFIYVQENGGMNSEADYPYVNKRQSCTFIPSAIAARCSGFTSIPEGDEHELATALNEVGPISVVIDSNLISNYGSGVFYNPKCNKDEPNHAMLLVGYGETAKGKKYWIVKNSWGEKWGEKGYMRIARNRDNHCGIATDACYPLM